MKKREHDFLRTGNRRLIFLSFLMILIPIVILLGIIMGSTNIDILDVFAVIKGKITNEEIDNISKSTITVIWDLRLPRVILSLVVGGGLAVCGAAMQAVTQNVLAEPYILGISSGASAMVAFAYFLGIEKLASGLTLNSFAFAGAFSSMVIVYIVGTVGGSTGGNRLILAGMSVSVILNALTNFLISILPNDSSLKNVISWMWGSLASARWTNIFLPICISLVGLFFFIAMSNSYNLISFGNETAVSMGVNYSYIVGSTLFIIAVMTGTFVSVCGLIGFIGFVIPHLVRLLIGAEYRKLFPCAYLLGAVFLCIMDILSRYIFAPREMAVGIFSAFIGGPLFVFLLLKKNRRP